MCGEDRKKVLLVYLSILIRKLVYRNTLELKVTFLKLKLFERKPDLLLIENDGGILLS
jgi:hypothetical protein